MDNQKKYLDADRLLAGIYSDNPKDVMLYIANFPAADVVEVVRCKDCKYGDTGTDENGRRFYKCIGIHYGGVSPDDYCSYGEHKHE